MENEKLLNNLHTINGQVSQSMMTTTDMAKNQEIAQSIRNENAQFASINSMAESNANDTT